ncbi:MAG: PKD domain-containing protein [Elusimicrobiota bacterium]
MRYAALAVLLFAAIPMGAEASLPGDGYVEPGACPAPAGVLSEWTFDNVSGNRVIDETGSNNGTIEKGATVAPGIVGDAASFQPGRVRMDKAYPFARGQNFSIEMWISWRKLSPSYPIFLDARQGRYQGYVISIIQGSGRVSASGRCDNGIHAWGVYSANDHFSPDDEWHHVAVTVNWAANESKMYVDGVLEGIQDNSLCDGLNRADKFHLGSIGDFDSPYRFYGRIDEVRVYKRALGPDEIKNIYECVADPSNEPPTADAGPDQRVLVGDTVAFDASGSQEPDGEIVSYAWDFGDNSAGAGLTAEHAYEEPGTYTATLVVTDDAGAQAADSAIITVRAPEEWVADMIAEIQGLGLPGGLENSVVSKLEAARESIVRGRRNAAINQLEAFINQTGNSGSQALQQMSDALKKQHDTAQSIINNLR